MKNRCYDAQTQCNESNITCNIVSQHLLFIFKVFITFSGLFKNNKISMEQLIAGTNFR